MSIDRSKANRRSAVEDLDLLRIAATGDESAFNEVLLKYRERLRKMVELRMNPRLRSRLDASDVIQDAFMEAAREREAYLRQPRLPVFLWLRYLAGQKLIQAHRMHLVAQKRSAYREQSQLGGAPSASANVLAAQLSGSFTSPSQTIQRREVHRELTSALERMDEVDREVLTLKHFEQMATREIAQVLDMNLEAVKKRYVRALDKLQQLLS